MKYENMHFPRNHQRIKLLNLPNRLMFALLIVMLCISGIASNQQDQFGANGWEIIETQTGFHPRHESGFVEVNGKFYLLGGRGIKPVDIFDPVNKQWSQGAEPPIEIHHFQAVVYRGKIYIIGAMTGKYPREKPLTNVLRYDPNKDQWSYGDEIPAHRRRGSAGVVVYRDKAIVLNGITDGHWDGHVAWVDQYDFQNGTWEELPDAPRTRDHFHAVINQGVIYCAGGRNSSAKTDQTFELTIPEVDIFDIETDSWKSLPNEHNLPTERAGTASTFWNNHLIVIGGESSARKKAHNEVQAYDPETGNWKSLDSLNLGRHGTQVIKYQDALYIASGSGNRGGRPELSSLEKYELLR